MPGGRTWRWCCARDADAVRRRGQRRATSRMNLLVIRHAIAEERKRYAKTGADDGLRPLTARGRRRMKAGARGLQRVVPGLDLLATSPLVRAEQTAEIVVAAYGELKVVKVPQLAPQASVHALLKWLQERKHD